MRLMLLLATLTTLTALPAHAQNRETIGVGRLFTNDYLGDGEDRWRTGSYVYSQIRAPRSYDAQRRFAFGELLEYRVRAEIIAADAPATAPGDRPYVGAVSFGVHTHFGHGPADISVGADVIATGPQTGLSRFQTAVHDSLDMPAPAFIDTQLGDSIHVQGTAALGQNVFINDALSVRPFATAQLGAENLLRVGGDVIVGTVGQTDLMLRDVVTGQLYRGTQSGDRGVSFVLGGDIAAVGDSIYLPPFRNVLPENTRTRARAGLHYQHREGASFFYGLTYLGPEFQDQPTGQLVGSVKLNFNF